MSKDQSPYDHGDGEEISAMSIMTEITDRLNQSGDDEAADALARACHVAFERLQVINTLREENAKLKMRVEDLEAEVKSTEQCRAFAVEDFDEQTSELNALRTQVEKLREVLKRIINIEVDVRPEDDYAERAEEFYNFVAVATNLALAAYEETGAALSDENTSKFVDQQGAIGDAQ